LEKIIFTLDAIPDTASVSQKMGTQFWAEE